MPAFLLSRKQKSLEYFFALLRLYIEKNLSLEQLWSTQDTQGHFGSIKTLYRYHRDLIHHINDILTLLSKEIILIHSSFMLPDILPGNISTREKLRVLFFLLDSLIDLLYQKNRTGILLQKERHAFLHFYLFNTAGILILNSS